MGYWDAYYKAVGERPGTLVVEALPRIAFRGLALDLGAGNLRDAKYLLAQGFKAVTAVDRETPPPPVEGVEYIKMPLEHYVPAHDTYDFVLCCNTLFFFQEKDAVCIITRAFNALKDGGLLACNLLGDKDEWAATGAHGTHGHTQTRVDAMLSCFEEKVVTRFSGIKKTARGADKFWDMWTVHVKK